MSNVFKKTGILISIALIISCLLTIMLVFDLFKSEDVFIILMTLGLLSFGIYCFKIRIGKIMVWFALFLLFIFVFTHPNFWLLLLTIGLGAWWLWQGVIRHMQKNYESIRLELIEPDSQKYGRIQKAYWLQEKATLAHQYEWDDIHLVSWFGDTVIHLGNTVLPEDTSVIVIHKAVGDIRIIVPLGVGIALNHSTLRGHVLFDKEHYFLKNEQLSVYSENYTTLPRRIKIVTTVYVGNVEIIHI